MIEDRARKRTRENGTTKKEYVVKYLQDRESKPSELLSKSAILAAMYKDGGTDSSEFVMQHDVKKNQSTRKGLKPACT